MKIFRQKRNITLDTSVLIAWIITKHEDSIVKKVVTKSITDDRLMLTDIIYHLHPILRSLRLLPVI